MEHPCPFPACPITNVPDGQIYCVRHETEFTRTAARKIAQFDKELRRLEAEPTGPPHSSVNDY